LYKNKLRIKKAWGAHCRRSCRYPGRLRRRMTKKMGTIRPCYAFLQRLAKKEASPKAHPMFCPWKPSPPLRFPL